MYTRMQLQRGFVARGETGEGVATTAQIFYWHEPGGSVFTEHAEFTYHYSDTYGDDEPDRTITDARAVGYREMMKTIAVITNEFGYQPW